MKKIVECFKEMPCTLKFAYVLIILSMVISISVCMKLCCKSGKSVKSSGSVSGDSIAEWVKNNPEAILESVNNYVMQEQEKAQKEQQAAASKNIVKFENELKSAKNAGVLNPKGKVTLVEFYDYNCGYCKMAANSVDELMTTRKDVRVVLRSIPILGEASRYASEVEMAIIMIDASKQPEFYTTLMRTSARTKEQVNQAAKEVGISLDRLNKTLSSKKDEIAKAIEENMKLASNIGVSGTPAFIANGQLIPGAVDAKTLSDMLK